jgi:hypothetical protein
MEQHRIRSALAAALTFAVSCAVGLGLLEVASRWLMPISPGMRWVLPGDAPSQSPDQVVFVANRLRFLPNVSFRQVAAEFDVLTTIGKFGHRVPEPQGNPDLVFLGDSFTWGQGVEDDQTFASLYCQALQLSCADLARPATGTGTQVDILEDYLTHEGWRPREVKLFMLVMTSALMTGNDLVDNLDYAQAFPNRLVPGPRVVAEPDAPSPGSVPVDVNTLGHGAYSPAEWIVKQRAILLRESNLVRVVYSIAGLKLREWLTPAAAEDRLHQALDITRGLLARLDADSREFGFHYEIVLLHPIQDLARGTDRQTLEALREIAPPGVHVLSTADALRDQPSRFYFPFDGHLNASGHRRVAEFLRSAAP